MGRIVTWAASKVFSRIAATSAAKRILASLGSGIMWGAAFAGTDYLSEKLIRDKSNSDGATAQVIGFKGEDISPDSDPVGGSSVIADLTADELAVINSALPALTDLVPASIAEKLARAPLSPVEFKRIADRLDRLIDASVYSGLAEDIRYDDQTVILMSIADFCEALSVSRSANMLPISDSAQAAQILYFYHKHLIRTTAPDAQHLAEGLEELKKEKKTIIDNYTSAITAPMLNDFSFQLHLFLLYSIVNYARAVEDLGVSDVI